jgi:hypothetical protein
MGILILAGCRAGSSPEPAPEITPESTAPGARGRGPSNACGASPGRLCPSETLEARVLSIARDYARWGKLDVMPRWAPMPCAPPWRPSPGDMYMGEPTSEAAHGKKLYYLYASDPDDYTRYQPPKVVRPGQIIVKDAFLPVEVPGVPDREPLPAAHARSEGKVYRAGDPVGLFVMAKLDPGTEGTDEGWVYGVVAPGGAKVTAGKLEACMGCHRNAPRDRLFGFHRE